MASHRPPYGVGNNKATWAAIGQLTVFVLVVLFLFWIFGGFESW